MRPVVWLLLAAISLVAAVILFFGSRYARGSAADLLRGELSDALGREVAVRSVDFDLWSWHPVFEARGLVIPGPTPTDPAVLRLALLRARISWRALAKRRLDLEQVDVERPQIYLRFNPDGSTNLPHLRRGQGNQPQRVAIAIDRLLVENGTFQYNERRGRLDLTARAIWARLGEGEDGPATAALPAAKPAPPAARENPALAFQLTAQDVVLALPDAAPWPLTVAARGKISGGDLRLAAVRLSGPDLRLRVDGTISWRGENAIDLAADGRLATHWLNRVHYLDEPIDGTAAVAGHFALQHTVWGYWGRLTAPRIGILHREFRDLVADFRGDTDRLAVDVRRSIYAQGEVSGPVVIETGAPSSPLGGRPVVLDLAIRGMALQPFLVDLFPDQFAGPAPDVELAGRANGRLRFRFQSSRWRTGSGQADLQVEAAQAGMAGSEGLRVAGSVPLQMAAGVLTGGAIQVTAPGQEGTVSGFTYNLQSGAGRLDYRLVSHDTGALAALFPPAPPRLPTAHWTGPPLRTPIWLPEVGHGTATGAVTITPTGYSAGFDLDLHGVVSQSLGAADRLTGTLTLEPQAVENLRLEATAGEAALMLSGRIPFAPRPGVAPATPLDLAVDAAEWPAAGLIPYLPAWFPIRGLAGAVSGRVDLGGDFDHLTGRADAEIEGLALAGIAVGHARGELSWDPARIAIADGVIENAAGKLLAHGSFERASEALDLTVDAPSLDLAAPPVAGLLHVPGLGGHVTVMAVVGGTFDKPRATASVHALGLGYGGQPLAGDAGGEAQASVTWDGELVRASGAVGNVLTFDGGGRLDRERAALRLDLRSANLTGLLHLAVPADVGGSLAGSLTYDADFAAGRQRGELRLDDLRLAYAGRVITNREPVVVDISPQQLDLRSVYLGEPGTDLELYLAGTVGLAAPMPLNLRLQSTIAATWLKLALPGLDAAGSVDVLAAVRGRVGDPDLSGQAVLHEARVVIPNLGTLDGMEGTLRFYRDRLVLDELTGRLGGGTVRMSGQVALPGAGRTLGYRFEMAAQGVSVRYPEGWVSRGDATLSLTGGDTTRQVQGTVRLDRAVYVEDLQVDLIQLLVRGLARQRVQVSAANPLLAGTQLSLKIQGANALRVTNNVADLRGDVQLTVAGTMATPVVFGTVLLEPGGTLEYGDNKYQVDHGGLTFANPNRIDPLIDVALKIEVQSYEITLNLSGTLEKFNAKFSSNADLADIDILGLLAAGQRPEIGAPPPPGPQSDQAGQAAASQFLAGQASAALGSRVGKLFGLDRFRVDTQTLTAAGEPTSGVVITAGKRLSKNIFVTYVSNPSSPRLDVRQVEWTVAKNVTVLLTQSGDSFAVDIQRETRF